MGTDIYMSADIDSPGEVALKRLPDWRDRERQFDARLRQSSQYGWGDVYEPGDMSGMARLVGGNPILKHCVAERAKYCTAYGFQIKDNEDEARSDLSEAETAALALVKQGLGRWCRRGWEPGGLTNALELIMLDRLIYGRGFAELRRTMETITYDDYEDGKVARRKIGKVNHLSRLDVRQCAPWSVKVPYGDYALTRQDPVDLRFPRLVYSQPMAGGRRGGRMYFKRFGDPRMIDRFTGEITTDAAMDANEWIDLKRAWSTSLIDGEPEHLGARDNTNVNEKVMTYLHNFFSNNCTPNFSVVVEGFEEGVEFTRKQLHKEIQEQLNGIAQVRGEWGYSNKAWVVILPPISRDMHPVKVTITPLNPMDNLKDMLELWKLNNVVTALIMNMPPRLVNQITQGSLGGAGDALGQLEQLITFTIQPDLHKINTQLLDPLVSMGLGIDAFHVRMKTPGLRDPRLKADLATAYSNTNLPPDSWLSEIGMPTLGEMMRETGDDIDPGKRIFLRAGTELVSLADMERLAAERERLPEGDEKTRAEEQMRATFGKMNLDAIKGLLPVLRDRVWAEVSSASIDDFAGVK